MRQASPRVMTHFYYEFAFFEAVRAYNDWALATGEDPITPTDAKYIHDMSQYELDLSTQPEEMRERMTFEAWRHDDRQRIRSGADAAIARISDAHPGAFDGPIMRNPPNEGMVRDIAASIANAFEAMGRPLTEGGPAAAVGTDGTGWLSAVGSSAWSEMVRMRSEDDFVGGTSMPLSPYDRWFADVRDMSSVGGRYDRPWDLRLIDDGPRASGAYPNVWFDGDVGTARSEMASFALSGVWCREGELDSTGAWASRRYPGRDDDAFITNVLADETVDVIGAGRILHHLSPEEQATFRNAVMRAIPGPDGIGAVSLGSESGRETVAAYQRAFARLDMVMDWLEGQGISYEVSRDIYPYQTQLTTKGPSSVSIRMMDHPNDVRYIAGRAYSSNVSVDASDPYLTRSNMSRTYEYRFVDTLGVMRWLMGEEVHRLDGDRGPIGTNEVVDGVNQTHFNTKGAARLAMAGNRQIRDGYAPRRVVWYAETTKSLRNPWIMGNAVPLLKDNTLTDQVEGLTAAVAATTEGGTRDPRYTSFDVATCAGLWLRKVSREARENLVAEIGVDELVATWLENREDGQSMPAWSSFASVARVQQACWDVLTGESDTLPAPDSLPDDEIDDAREEGREDEVVRLVTVPQGADRAQFVRDYLRTFVEDSIGSVDPSPTDGRTLNIDGVATWMDTAVGSIGTRALVVDAVRDADMDPALLRGDDISNRRARDMLVRFDPETAFPMSDPPESMGERGRAFVGRMHDELVATLRGTGVAIDDPATDENGNPVPAIMMDENGVISYRGRVEVREAHGDAPGDAWVEVRGTIGQLFVPDEEGVITTRYAGSDNYSCVPGYRAQVLPATSPATAGLTMEERTRLRGFEQDMAATLRQAVRVDVMGVVNRVTKSPTVEVRGATELNRVYRDLYDERLDANFRERAVELSRDEPGYTHEDAERLATLQVLTFANRVSYGDEMHSEATTYADHDRRQKLEAGIVENYHTRHPFALAGYSDVSIISESSDGIFDQFMTSSGTKQGITRYLVSGAEVDPATGAIKPDTCVDENGNTVRNKSAHAPLRDLPFMRYLDHNPADRGQMVTANALTAYSLTPEIGIACLSANGWGQDDGIVVFADSAQRFPTVGADGKPRPFRAGDKLCGCGGDKGVTSIIVDRDMDIEQARELGIEGIVQFGKDNPDVDVVMAPFSAGSRLHAATYKMLSENPFDLTLRDGNGEPYKVACGGGRGQLIVTHMTADNKVKVYDDDDLSTGGGRRVSSQLVWAIESMFERAHVRPAQADEWHVDADESFADGSAIMRSVFSENIAATRKLKEYALTLGVDMDGCGRLSLGIDPEAAASRELITYAKLGGYAETAGGLREDRAFTSVTKGLTGFRTPDRAALQRAFSDVIGRQGGMLALPFELKLAADANELARVNAKPSERKNIEVRRVTTPPLTEDGLAVETDPARLAALGYVRDLNGGKETGAWLRTGDKSLVEGCKFALPVMDHTARNGVPTADGSHKTHDHTRSIAKIAADATCWTYADDMIRAGEQIDARRGRLHDALASIGRDRYDLADDKLARNARDRIAKGLRTLADDGDRRARIPASDPLHGMSPDELRSTARTIEAASIGLDEAVRGFTYKDRYEGEKRKAAYRAQATYDSMARTISERQFDGKYNIAKTGVMCKRTARASTCVVTADPRLNLDELGIGRATAEKLKVKDGDIILVWRDPLLRGVGISAMRARVFDNINGVAIHPVDGMRFDADFDGDTFGLKVLEGILALREARDMLLANGLLVDPDFVVDPYAPADKMEHPLLFNFGLDAQVALHNHPELKDRLDAISREANETYRDMEAGRIDHDEYIRRNHETFADLNELVHDIYSTPVGEAVIRFASDKEGATEIEHAQAHLDSVYDACVRTGAKGSAEKLLTYARNAGMDAEIAYATVHDVTFDGSALDAMGVWAYRAGIEVTLGNPQPGETMTITVSDEDWHKLASEMSADPHGVKLASIDVESREVEDGLRVTAVHDKTCYTRAEQNGVQRSTAIKSNGTGLAGRFAQRGVMMGRSSCLSSVLAMTYPATQAILQAKHDPVDAARRYDMLLGCMRDLWQGKSVAWDGNEWVASEGPASSDEWVASAKRFYYDKKGLDIKVDPRHIENVGRELAGKSAYVGACVSTLVETCMREQGIDEDASRHVVGSVVVGAADVTRIDDEGVVMADPYMTAHVTDEGRDSLDEVMGALRHGLGVAPDKSGEWRPTYEKLDVSEWTGCVERFCADSKHGLASMLDAEFVEREGLVATRPDRFVADMLLADDEADLDGAGLAVADLVGQTAQAREGWLLDQGQNQVASSYAPSASSTTLDVLAYSEHSGARTGTQALVCAAINREGVFDGPAGAVANPSAAFMPREVEHNVAVRDGLPDRGERRDARTHEALEGIMSRAFGESLANVVERRAVDLTGKGSRQGSFRENPGSGISDGERHSRERNGVSVYLAHGGGGRGGPADGRS